MQTLISAMLLIVAVIHLVPLVGVVGSGQLSSLYGIDLSEPNVSILMRHRAVLFGLLGAFFVLAAFRPGLQPAAFVVAFISIVSFMLLAGVTGGYNARVSRVFTGDVVALAALVVAVIAYMVARREG
jgi:uncharacterized membrane protein